MTDTEEEGFKWVIDSIAECIPTAEKNELLKIRKSLGVRLTSKGVK